MQISTNWYIAWNNPRKENIKQKDISQQLYKPMAGIKANQREKIQYDFKNIDCVHWVFQMQLESKPF